MQNPEAYRILAKKLAPYNLIMGKAADTILNEAVSDYPIFVIPRSAVALGIPIVEGSGENAVHIYASTLEELATKNIIEMSKVGHFREVYKDPAEFLCLFVIGEDQASFVFLPRLQADN